MPSTEPEKLTPEERELLAGVPAEAWRVAVLFAPTWGAHFDGTEHVIIDATEECPLPPCTALCGKMIPNPVWTDEHYTGLHLLANWPPPDEYDPDDPLDAPADPPCPACAAKLQLIARAALKALGGEVGDRG